MTAVTLEVPFDGEQCLVGSYTCFVRDGDFAPSKWTSRKMNLERTLQIVLALLLCVGGSAYASEGLPPLPGEIFSLEDYSVPGSSTRQIYFRKRSSYPQSNILSHYEDGLAQKWVKCKSTTHGWTTYTDSAEGKQRFVHQLVRYWVDFERDKMFTLMVRYYSDGSTPRCRPDTNVQHGFVFVSRSEDIRQDVKYLALQCGFGLVRAPEEIPEASSCSSS